MSRQRRIPPFPAVSRALSAAPPLPTRPAVRRWAAAFLPATSAAALVVGLAAGLVAVLVAPAAEAAPGPVQQPSISAPTGEEAAEERRSAEQAQLLARAQESLDAGQPQQALDLVEPLLAERPDDARGLLLRSTAHFMLGDLEAGRRDLERSLALDPAQRQGWLNRAALAVSEQRYDAALEAFRRAESLDPQAPDNDVNLGAVLLLRGDLEAASKHFQRYLQGPGNTADGYYLVASNYALAGYAALAVEHLRQAVDHDERIRRRARTDANFRALHDNPRFQRLLAHDVYEPPPGSYAADQTFSSRYDGGRGTLLPAVLDALQLGNRPFDPQVEVTEAWALIWGDLRIKVSDTLGGRGRVQLTAPPGAFTPAEWHRTTGALLEQIGQQALRRKMAVEEQRKRQEEADPLRPLPR